MRVVIVDDDIRCTKRTIEWLNNYQYITILFTATDGHDFLLKLQKEKQKIDVVLMDIGMRPMDGCATTYVTKLMDMQPKIIAYTTYNDYEMVRNCFLCGVDGFVMKPFAEQELPAAIEHVAKGSHYLDSNLRLKINETLFEKIIHHKQSFWNKPFEIDFKLTKRERLFIALASTSLVYKEIGDLMHVEEATAQQMYNRLAKKLGLRSIKDLALFALQNGLAMQANFLFSNRNNMPY
jgi:two-component system, NarL family, invasion response regulator UvrY